MRHKYDNTIKRLHYKNFYLDVGRYYIIEVLKAKVDTDKDKTPFKGIAQLTRIDFIDEEYYVVHFKHNKAEYLQYISSRYFESFNTCVCIQPQIAEFGFSFNNSRIRIDDNGDEYFPENYKPGVHIK